MKKILLVLFSFATICAQAQQTLGLFTQSPGSTDGYVLFAPLAYTKTYLIDKCGRLVHDWTSTYKPGISVYMLPDGDLLRTGTTDNPDFGVGGTGGVIERMDWNSNVSWRYFISDSMQCQHHDICPMPNGNVLAVVWEQKTPAEALAAGRNPAHLGVWSEKIVELKPIGNDSAEIVWQWDVWDHLVQEFDNTKANFDSVSHHPELVDLNYYLVQSLQDDWLHINAVTYNAELDQIMISSHTLSEIWIIDHSTTTAQAATHSGGAHNKGGDLLYRWGNPQVYHRGDSTDRTLYWQHDPIWIHKGADSGKIMIFNNGLNRPGGNYSSVDIITPPVTASGDYTIAAGQAYLPVNAGWSYSDPTPTNFFGSFISGAQRLDNGNTLICNGPTGVFFEITPDKNTVWRYVNPVDFTGPVSQGSTPVQNLVFRCTLYPPDYSGLASHTLTPGSPIELNPLPYVCHPATIKNINAIAKADIQVVNPFDNVISLSSNDDLGKVSISLLNITGAVCRSWNNTNIYKGQNSLQLDVQLPAGIYILNIKNNSSVYNIKLSKE